MMDVPASQFLCPKVGTLRAIHPLHVRTIKRALTHAARINRGYHLWRHPHNFGLKTADNLAALSDVLAHFQNLKNEYGMVPRSMSPLAL